MNWYKKAKNKERIIKAKAQIITIDDLPTIEEDEDKETERARKYFNIGHGEDVEEFGYAPRLSTLDYAGWRNNEI